MTNKSSLNQRVSYGVKTKLKLILFSFIGFAAFFISFKLTPDGRETILIEHIANLVKQLLNYCHLDDWFCIVLMVVGAILPFYHKTWNRSITDFFFTIFKIIGVFVGFMFIFKIGPDFLFEKNEMIDFLFIKLVMTLSFIIPVGSAFIIFLTDYGLMELIGILAKPIMRPIYKTPGRSAVDAVASFLGSYSIALLITGKQYHTGNYTRKESAIIATGFSTVSATFCLIVARTLGLMEHWNFFFWSALVITFIVTAITVRIWPLRSIPNDYIDGIAHVEAELKSDEGRLKQAVHSGLSVSAQAAPIAKNMIRNLYVGLSITTSLTPTIMSIGLLGLLLAKFTPLFSILGYAFYPITLLLQFPEPAQVAEALSMGIAEMFLPAAMVASSGSMIIKYVIGVTCISQVLFFSASIPCMISVGIPLTIKNMVIIWYERVVLSILISTPVAWLFFQ